MKENIERLYKSYGLSRRTCRALVNRFGQSTSPNDWSNFIELRRVEGIGGAGLDSIRRVLVSNNIKVTDWPCRRLQEPAIDSGSVVWVWKGNPDIEPCGPFHVVGVSGIWVKLKDSVSAMKSEVYPSYREALRAYRAYFQQWVTRIDKQISELDE